MLPFKLEQPVTLEEAVSMLSDGADGPVMLKAGGTDLIPWMNKFLVHPQTLVDLSGIPCLSMLEYRPDDGLYIGALATVNRVAKLPQVHALFPALEDACLSHSDQLIRNKATVVGNVCAAVPSGDMIPALMAYDASVHIAGPSGETDVPLEEFIVGPRRTVLKKNEIVVYIKVPAHPGLFSGCYLKLGRRNALDLAQVGVACVVRDMASDPVYSIACGAVAPRVLRIKDAEEMLKGVKRPDSALLEKVAEAAMNAVSPISDVRASMEYRRDQVGELVKRAVTVCMTSRQ